MDAMKTKPSAPVACPTCGAGVLLPAEQRVQYACFGAVVRVADPDGWSQTWRCLLPRRGEDALDVASLPPTAGYDDGPQPALASVAPVARLEVVEGTVEAPRRVRFAYVAGGVADWQELRAWSRSGRTVIDHIQGALTRTNRLPTPMTGTGAA